MDKLSTVILKPGEADRVAGGHPWIYQGSILRLTQPVEDGGLVQIKDHRQRLLGVGFYNSKSKIQVRVLARDRVEVDDAFFAGRIQAALAWRQKYLPGATSFRVVNAEGDFLSGLIVDKYEEVLVIQTSSLGMDRHKAAITRVLENIFQPRAILERNDMSSRSFEGLPEVQGILAGSLGEGQPPVSGGGPEGGADSASLRSWIRINDLEFFVNLTAGHKTGFYLDQQVNYRRVAELAKGARVLDCFCFQGGFALHAARAGAVSIHALDQSQEALDAARQNAEANHLSGGCTFEAANVFDWLKAHTTTRPNEKLIPKFDLVILDPPSFTRNRSSIPEAMRGYKEIHLRAFKLVRPGGTVATFCCSHHVDAGMFQEVILEAAFDARRVLRRVAAYQPSPDHPVVPAIPESEYLKGFALEVLA